jgi:hypothetical protein
MKRTEAEPAIRHLTHAWAKAAGVAVCSAEQPSCSDFKDWADGQGYSSYFSFSSTVGALEDAERRFDEELRQTWRN